MTQLKSLIQEIHRRSLWQVMGIFLAASWGVLQVVEVITETVGLPDWTPGMAFVLLLIGFPIVVATAFVQEGMPGATLDAAGLGTDPEGPEVVSAVPTKTSSQPASSTPSLLTWRNALLGGLGAFTLLGISLVGYFVMWEAGIGPWGNLAAQGVFEEGEPILLAEFDNQSNDPTLGSVVTEALRVDLASSQVITLVPGSRIDEILGLMQAPEDQALDARVALEIAERGGIKAVIDGDVGSAGSGYIFSATIRATETGDPLATFRRTAKTADDVIEAIDGLSQDIREKAGESLRAIKAEAPLEAVTTASLEALRLYAEAEEISEQGDEQRAKQMLLRAIDLDPEFAMAWRKLSVVIQTAGGEPGEQQQAATRAYQLAERLTTRERLNAAAYYYNAVTGDLPAQIQAYESLLAEYPDDAPALNNLSIAYADRTRFADAIPLLERAISGPGRSAPAHVNLTAYYASVGRVDDARATQALMLERYPDRGLWPAWTGWWTELMDGQTHEAHRHGESLVNMADIPAVWRGVGWGLALTADAVAGRLAEARSHRRDGTAAQAALDDPSGMEFLATGSLLAEFYASSDTASALAWFEDFLASPLFTDIPPEAHGWPGLMQVATVLGDEELISRMLSMWSSSMGDAAGTPLSEARTVVDALDRPDPRSSINALRAYRSQVGCPRCYGWQIAEFYEADGDLSGAVAAYEDLLEAPASNLYNDYPAQRVVARERLGRLYEELGDSAKAVEHYAAFADAWAEADSDLQPRVRHARERAAALGG